MSQLQGVISAWDGAATDLHHPVFPSLYGPSIPGRYGAHPSSFVTITDNITNTFGDGTGGGANPVHRHAHGRSVHGKCHPTSFMQTAIPRFLFSPARSVIDAALAPVPHYGRKRIDDNCKYPFYRYYQQCGERPGPHPEHIASDGETKAFLKQLNGSIWENARKQAMQGRTVKVADVANAKMNNTYDHGAKPLSDEGFTAQLLENVRRHNPAFPSDVQMEPPMIVIDYKSPTIAHTNINEAQKWFCDSPGEWAPGKNLSRRKFGDGPPDSFEHPTIEFRDPVPGNLHVYMRDLETGAVHWDRIYKMDMRRILDNSTPALSKKTANRDKHEEKLIGTELDFWPICPQREDKFHKYEVVFTRVKDMKPMELPPVCKSVDDDDVANALEDKARNDFLGKIQKHEQMARDQDAKLQLQMEAISREGFPLEGVVADPKTENRKFQVVQAGEPWDPKNRIKSAEKCQAAFALIKDQLKVPDGSGDTLELKSDAPVEDCKLYPLQGCGYSWKSEGKLIYNPKLCDTPEEKYRPSAADASVSRIGKSGAVRAGAVKAREGSAASSQAVDNAGTSDAGTSVDDAPDTKGKAVEGGQKNAVGNAPVDQGPSVVAAKDDPAVAGNASQAAASATVAGGGGGISGFISFLGGGGEDQKPPTFDNYEYQRIEKRPREYEALDADVECDKAFTVDDANICKELAANKKITGGEAVPFAKVAKKPPKLRSGCSLVTGPAGKKIMVAVRKPDKLTRPVSESEIKDIKELLELDKENEDNYTAQPICKRPLEREVGCIPRPSAKTPPLSSEWSKQILMNEDPQRMCAGLHTEEQCKSSEMHRKLCQFVRTKEESKLRFELAGTETPTDWDWRIYEGKHCEYPVQSKIECDMAISRLNKAEARLTNENGKDRNEAEFIPELVRPDTESSYAKNKFPNEEYARFHSGAAIPHVDNYPEGCSFSMQNRSAGEWVGPTLVFNEVDVKVRAGNSEETYQVCRTQESQKAKEEAEAKAAGKAVPPIEKPGPPLPIWFAIAGPGKTCKASGMKQVLDHEKCVDAFNALRQESSTRKGTNWLPGAPALALEGPNCCSIGAWSKRALDATPEPRPEQFPNHFSRALPDKHFKKHPVICDEDHDETNSDQWLDDVKFFKVCETGDREIKRKALHIDKAVFEEADVRPPKGSGEAAGKPTVAEGGQAERKQAQAQQGTVGILAASVQARAVADASKNIADSNDKVPDATKRRDDASTTNSPGAAVDSTKTQTDSTAPADDATKTRTDSTPAIDNAKPTADSNYAESKAQKNAGDVTKLAAVASNALNHSSTMLEINGSKTAFENGAESFMSHLQGVQNFWASLASTAKKFGDGMSTYADREAKHEAARRHQGPTKYDPDKVWRDIAGIDDESFDKHNATLKRDAMANREFRRNNPAGSGSIASSAADWWNKPITIDFNEVSKMLDQLSTVKEHEIEENPDHEITSEYRDIMDKLLGIDESSEESGNSRASTKHFTNHFSNSKKTSTNHFRMFDNDRSGPGVGIQKSAFGEVSKEHLDSKLDTDLLDEAEDLYNRMDVQEEINSMMETPLQGEEHFVQPLKKIVRFKDFPVEPSATTQLKNKKQASVGPEMVSHKTVMAGTGSNIVGNTAAATPSRAASTRTSSSTDTSSSTSSSSSKLNKLRGFFDGESMKAKEAAYTKNVTDTFQDMVLNQNKGWSDFLGIGSLKGLGSFGGFGSLGSPSALEHVVEQRNQIDTTDSLTDSYPAPTNGQHFHKTAQLESARGEVIGGSGSADHKLTRSLKLERGSSKAEQLRYLDHNRHTGLMKKKNTMMAHYNLPHPKYLKQHYPNEEILFQKAKRMEEAENARNKREEHNDATEAEATAGDGADENDHKRNQLKQKNDAGFHKLRDEVERKLKGLRRERQLREQADYYFAPEPTKIPNFKSGNQSHGPDHHYNDHHEHHHSSEPHVHGVRASFDAISEDRALKHRTSYREEKDEAGVFEKAFRKLMSPIELAVSKYKATPQCPSEKDMEKVFTTNANEYSDVIGRMIISESHSTAVPADHTGMIPWLGD